ncbi:MAG: MerC domain-containing protein [Saprospiraceae bacterium]|nr:MerC domain-containing protein [Saprospiraceae bacterium]
MRRFFTYAHTDLLGFSASMLCAVHCGLLPVILTLSVLNGLQWLAEPWIETTFLATSIVIAIIALGRNFRNHKHILRAIQVVALGFVLIIASRFLPHETSLHFLMAALGGLTVAAGHILNWRLARKSPCCTEGH